MMLRCVPLMVSLNAVTTLILSRLDLVLLQWLSTQGFKSAKYVMHYRVEK